MTAVEFEEREVFETVLGKLRDCESISKTSLEAAFSLLCHLRSRWSQPGSYGYGTRNTETAFVSDTHNHSPELRLTVQDEIDCAVNRNIQGQHIAHL